MKDYLTLGPNPADEECVQVGNPDYYKLAKAECQRYIELIRNIIGPEPFGAALIIKSFPHDFGSYMEVCCVYDDEIEEATEYAYKCEGESPTKWAHSSVG